MTVNVGREVAAMERMTNKELRTRYAEEDALEADRDVIVSWYRSRGFLSAKATVDVQEDPEHRRTRGRPPAGWL